MNSNKAEVARLSGLARYHRAMAVAAAGDNESCDYHSGKMNAALEDLRQLGLKIARENADSNQEYPDARTSEDWKRHAE